MYGFSSVEEYEKEKFEDSPAEVIQVKKNRLVILRSRDCPYEFLQNTAGKKRFAIAMFITGPAGPGDR